MGEGQCAAVRRANVSICVIACLCCISYVCNSRSELSVLDPVHEREEPLPVCGRQQHAAASLADHLEHALHLLDVADVEERQL